MGHIPSDTYQDLRALGLLVLPCHKVVKINLGSSLDKTDIAHILNATYQDQRSI